MGNLWFVYALSSSALWGFSYALSEKILKGYLSPLFYLSFSGLLCLIMSLSLCLYHGQFRQGVQTLAENPKVLLIAMVTSICYVLGNLLIYMSISLKNATLANIIEITYPLFTLLFAYLLYREVQLNAWTAAGTVLILSGVVLIAAKS